MEKYLKKSTIIKSITQSSQLSPTYFHTFYQGNKTYFHIPLKKISYFHTWHNIKQMPGFVFLINFDVLFHVCVLENKQK